MPNRKHRPTIHPNQQRVLELFGLSECPKETVVVNAIARFSRGNSGWTRWLDVPVYLQVLNSTHLTVIAVDGSNWADYCLDDYDIENNLFACEDYVMQIDCNAVNAGDEEDHNQPERPLDSIYRDLSGA